MKITIRTYLVGEIDFSPLDTPKEPHFMSTVNGTPVGKHCVLVNTTVAEVPQNVVESAPAVQELFEKINAVSIARCCHE